MGSRSLVLLSIFAAAVSLAPSARADVPPADGGTTTTTTTGAGGATSGNNLNCTIPEEQVAGTTCQECDPSGSTAAVGACSALDSTFNMVCQYSSSIQVWCNGPIRDVPQDQNVASCAVAVPGGAWSGMAACAIAAAAALATRRRRRS